MSDMVSESDRRGSDIDVYFTRARYRTELGVVENSGCGLYYRRGCGQGELESGEGDAALSQFKRRASPRLE